MGGRVHLPAAMGLEVVKGDSLAQKLIVPLKK